MAVPKGRGIGVIYALESKGMMTADRKCRMGHAPRSLETAVIERNRLEQWTCDRRRPSLVQARGRNEETFGIENKSTEPSRWMSMVDKKYYPTLEGYQPYLGVVPLTACI